MSDKQKLPTWFKPPSDTSSIRPPIFIPDVPAPEWVRQSIGNRNVTPSTFVFPHSSVEKDEKDQDNRNGNVVIEEVGQNKDKDGNNTQNQSDDTDLVNLFNGLSLKQDEQNTDLSEEKEEEEKPLEVDVKILSTLCHVKWSVSAKKAKDHHLLIRLLSNTTIIEEKELSVFAPFYEFNLNPGRRYRIEVELINKMDKEIVEKFSHAFQSVFSLFELDSLYLLAKKFVEQKPMQMINVLYRVKPRRYFEDIKKYCNGSMVPYLKDNSGHLASPINRKVKGLFFLGSTQNGSLPSTSPFGDTRFTIKALNLLDPQKVNVYFTDFYCSSRRHYVTVVVCQKGSEADRFCSQNTKLLDISTNPFLRIIKTKNLEKGPEFMIFVNNWVHVEICYTESIPLDQGELKPIQAFGAGTSTFGGLSNNKNCQKCNLPVIKKT